MALDDWCLEFWVLEEGKALGRLFVDSGIVIYEMGVNGFTGSDLKAVAFLLNGTGFRLILRGLARIDDIENHARRPK